MKYRFLIAILISTTFLHGSFAQNSTVQNELPQLLSSYYSIKNALVAGNADDAASAAVLFTKTANAIDCKIIAESNIRALVKDVEKISATGDIIKQRSYFTNFSTNLAVVAKAVKLTGQPIYQAYCPMKKASWLSSEKEIKNPYFGKAMPTCGEVTETIQ